MVGEVQRSPPQRTSKRNEFPLRSTYHQIRALFIIERRKDQILAIGCGIQIKDGLIKISNPVRIFSIYIHSPQLIIIICGNKISNLRLAHMQCPKMIEAQEQTFISQSSGIYFYVIVSVGPQRLKRSEAKCLCVYPIELDRRIRLIENSDWAMV